MDAYDANGIYVDTLQTINGCDGIVTMNLINYSILGFDTTGYDSVSWNDNYDTSGTY